MVFRLKKLEDLTKWENIVRSIKFKKTKVNVKGVGIFAVKPNTNFTKVVYLKVEGLEDIIHDIVAKAIEAELVSEK
jgi:2'-5' RNA ligase